MLGTGTRTEGVYESLSSILGKQNNAELYQNNILIRTVQHWQRLNNKYLDIIKLDIQYIIH